MSQAFSEAEQTVVKRPKTVPKTYTEDENIPADNAPWVFFVGNVSVGGFSTPGTGC